MKACRKVSQKLNSRSVVFTKHNAGKKIVHLNLQNYFKRRGIQAPHRIRGPTTEQFCKMLIT